MSAYNETNIKDLIQQRLAMQSTQRTLLAYGIKNTSLEYILSNSFFERYSNLPDFQKKEVLKILAGKFNWQQAKALIENK